MLRFLNEYGSTTCKYKQKRVKHYATFLKNLLDHQNFETFIVNTLVLVTTNKKRRVKILFSDYLTFLENITRPPKFFNRQCYIT